MPEEGTPQAVSSVGLRHKIEVVQPDAPLALLVHGRAGNFDVMWAFRRTLPAGVSILAFQAPMPDPIGGFSWWNVADDGRTDPAKGISAAALLTSAFLRAKAYYKLTPPKVVAYGFSQGGALLSVALQRPDLSFDGVAMLASFVLKTDISGQIRPTPVFIAHGLRDEVVPIDLARVGAEHLRSIGHSVQFYEDPVGHKIGPTAIRELTRWSGEVLLGSAGAPTRIESERQ